MKITSAEAASQFRRAVAAWPFILDIERGYGLPPCLLFAVGSRETGLNPVYTEGQIHGDGHGWGLFGADDRWNALSLPSFANDARAQAELCAKTLVAHMHKSLDLVEAINAYGPEWARGTEPDDYGPDVLARRDVMASLSKEAPMELWHPGAERVTPADGHTGLSFVDVPPKIVLHTTETDAYSPSRSSYYGNPYWPHATITSDGIYQHLPINVGAYALAHEYGPETNRANAIQCEIVWRAANGDWPDALLDQVASWISWVAEQTGTPIEFAEMFREGVTVASVDSPIRFGDDEWLAFTGICGHSNVPGGNDHWDPGRLPVDRLRERLSPTPAPVPTPIPVPPPKRAKEKTLYTYGVPDDGGIWLAGFDDQPGVTVHVPNPDEVSRLGNEGITFIGEMPQEFHAGFKKQLS